MGKVLTEKEALKLSGGHIVIPEEYTEIEKFAFTKSDITSVEIPGSIKEIGNCAFSGCDKLESVVILDGVEKIGMSAFSSCMRLETVTMADTVKVIGESAFIFCDNLKSVRLSQGLVAFGGNVFSRAALRSITIPALVKYMYPIAGNELRNIEAEYSVICDELFAGCYDLTEINVDPGNERFKSVDGVLFTKDMAILLDYPAGKPQNTYTIPDGVKIVNHESFGGCRNLESIALPESLEEIDDGAFIFCEKLRGVAVPKNVSRIAPSAFGNCESMTDIFVDEANESFASIGGALASKDRTVLIKYPEGRAADGSEYAIPESVAKIGYSAFTYNEKDRDDKGVVKVTVHENVADIDMFAFYNKEHFVIRCREGTPAHKHAVEEKIAFELI